MSTPIVNFAPGNSEFSDKNIGFGALELYIAISLPLMGLTFVAWYFVYWWEKRKDRNANARTQTDAEAV